MDKTPRDEIHEDIGRHEAIIQLLKLKLSLMDLSQRRWG